MNSEQKKLILKRIGEIRCEKESAIWTEQLRRQNGIPSVYARAARWLREQDGEPEGALSFMLENWARCRPDCNCYRPVRRGLGGYPPVARKIAEFQESDSKALKALDAEILLRLKKLRDASETLKLSIMLENASEDILRKLKEFSDQDF